MSDLPPVRSCRSCKAPVRWALTTSGARMQLDAVAVEGGGWLVDGKDTDGRFVCRRVEPLLYQHGDAPRFVSHFATCPDAQEHRRRG